MLKLDIHYKTKVFALKKVLIIHTDGNTYNNPTLKAVVDLLLNRGIEVQISYPKSQAAMPSVKGVTLHPISGYVLALKLFLYERPALNLVMLMLARIEFTISKFLMKKKPDLIIAVDRFGLIDAYYKSCINKTPYIYMSFEIFFGDENKYGYKSLEVLASKKIQFWTVQDCVRGALQAEENGLNRNRCMYIPIGSSGGGGPSATRLRDRLGIEFGKKVAIMIGGIYDWTMVEEIIQSTSSWPSDWVLILHDRYGNTKKSLIDLGVNIESWANKNIFISEEAPDMVDDLGSVLSGISVGLAFYRPNYIGGYCGKNLQYLGFASGKISTYLRHGVPIIVNEIGLYADAARTHGFGIVVDRPSGIDDALHMITDGKFEIASRKYFHEKLDFNNYKDEFMQRLEGIVNSTVI